MRISTSTRRFTQKLGEEEGIALLARAGFDALDLSIDVYTEDIRNKSWQDVSARYKAYAEKYGVKYNQAHAPYGGGRGDLNTRGNYVTNLAPIIPEALRMAAAAGVETVVTHPLCFLDTGYQGHEEEHFEANLKFYSGLIPVARELGIRVAVENLWHTSDTTGNIVEAACGNPYSHAALVRELNAPDVITACLDVGHAALVGRDPVDVIRTLGHDTLGALHVHDVDYKRDLHTLPWLSKLDWGAITSALGEINYTGDLTLEADSFVAKFDGELLTHGAEMMAKVARRLADMIDAARP